MEKTVVSNGGGSWSWDLRLFASWEADKTCYSVCICFGFSGRAKTRNINLIINIQ